jgi:hypothetical protein
MESGIIILEGQYLVTFQLHHNLKGLGLGLDLEGLAGGHVILRIRYLYGTVLLSATLSTLSPSHNLASILVPLHTSTGCKTEGGRAM